MIVPFNDLNRIHSSLRSELDAAWKSVVDTGGFIQGPHVSRFEEEFASYCQSEGAVGVSSGTDALLMALMALGIGPGDEVITTPFTFFATAGVIHRLGASPVFADIDPTTFNLDPADVAPRITGKTRAIIAVHLFGQMANLSELKQLIEGKEIHLIEDAAQSVGAEDGQGNRAGSVGTLGCFSFFPAKNLGAFGDGGGITAQDPELLEQLRILRVHGAKKKYFHETVGGNFRLDAIQAAILGVKLPHLEKWTESRIENARALRERLTPLETTFPICLPKEGEGRHVYNQFVVRTPLRDRLREVCEQKGIQTAVYYPKALHQQVCFGFPSASSEVLPQAEKACKEVVALPIFPGLTEQELDRIGEVITEFYEQG